MGELGAFLKIERAPAPERDPRERVADYDEIYQVLPAEEARRQGARCMECGVPFCHEGCPLGNLIPDWNDLVYRGRWREALDQLHSTNNFPEFTGLICPAPCEPACVLAINSDPVSIKQIELAIVERGWEEGWIVPRPPSQRTGRSVAIVGSGPAGLAGGAAAGARGPRPVVYERDEGPGGLIRFGVPDCKLEKWIIDRRVAPARGRGRRAALRRRCRPRHLGRRAARRARRGDRGDRLARAPRPRRPGARPRGRALRDGLPLHAQPLGGGGRRAPSRDGRTRSPPRASTSS